VAWTSRIETSISAGRRRNPHVADGGTEFRMYSRNNCSSGPFQGAWKRGNMVGSGSVFRRDII
jgi:hypothetical protein